MTNLAHHPATPLSICFLLLLSNIFAGCPQRPDASVVAETEITLGTYNLQPMTVTTSLKDLVPAYRLVSSQASGYLVSSDTGLSYLVEKSDGQLTHIDKSDFAVFEPTRVFAAADDALWLVTASRLKHSKGRDGVALVGDKVRVLWFSARQILLWGEYLDDKGGTGNGLQLYGLDASDRVSKPLRISAAAIAGQVADFAGAEKFIAGGVVPQGFWLWTRESGLLIMRAQREQGTGGYSVEERATISLPRVAGKVFKDIGFNIDITTAEITAPAYVLGIAAGEGNRGELYIAVKP